MKQIRCFTLPRECEGNNVGPNVIVIDVLRASTTICTALANGAKCIRPFPDVDMARNYALNQAEDVLTGGERGGEKLPGFDLGNSPLEYLPGRVAERVIAFTTTNGTAAMEKCKNATTVAIGAFCNASAVISHFQSAPQIDVVCAGTDGELSDEDCAFAGLVVDRLTRLGEYSLNEGAEICRQQWHQAEPDLVAYMQQGCGGQNLLRLGRSADIDYAARLDSLSIVPILEIDQWKIEPA